MAEKLEIRPKRTILYFRIAGSFVVPIIIASVIATVACVKDAPGVGMLAAMVLLVLAALSAVHAWFHFHSIRYEIDDTHLVSMKGVFWKVKRSTPLEKITNVDVRQGPIDRLLGVGKVWIFTPSTGSLLPEEMLSGVENPHEIRKAILDRTGALRGGTPVASSASTDSSPQVVSLLREISATLRNIEAKLKE